MKRTPYNVMVERLHGGEMRVIPQQLWTGDNEQEYILLQGRGDRLSDFALIRPHGKIYRVSGDMTPETTAALDGVPEWFLRRYYPNFDYTEQATQFVLAAWSRLQREVTPAINS